MESDERQLCCCYEREGVLYLDVSILRDELQALLQATQTVEVARIRRIPIDR